MNFVFTITLSLLLLFSTLSSFSQKDPSVLFEKSKGKLSFPVCTIYGYADNKCVEHTRIDLPPYKNITFITDSAAEIRSVYAGRVYRVFTIENDFAAVVNYGKYFITYYPLQKPVIKKNDLVIAGQPIAKVARLGTTSEINILISKETHFLDPYKWFRW